MMWWRDHKKRWSGKFLRLRLDASGARAFPLQALGCMPGPVATEPQVRTCPETFSCPDRDQGLLRGGQGDKE